MGNVTKLFTNCSREQIDNTLSIKTFNSSSLYAELLAEYESITKLPPPGAITKATVVHHIENSGPPVYARPRRLPADKLEAARKEFEYLMKAGICSPSKSNWASPLHMVKKADNTPGDHVAITGHSML